MGGGEKGRRGRGGGQGGRGGGEGGREGEKREGRGREGGGKGGMWGEKVKGGNKWGALVMWYNVISLPRKQAGQPQLIVMRVRVGGGEVREGGREGGRGRVGR